jgi:hypothetical protein
VSRVVTDVMTLRDGLYHAMTGDPFDGKKAAEMRLVNYAVPGDQLRAETVKLAKKLMEKNPWALRATKQAYKLVRNMDYSQAEDYLAAKGAQIKLQDREGPPRSRCRTGRVATTRESSSSSTTRPTSRVWVPWPGSTRIPRRLCLDSGDPTA